MQKTKSLNKTIIVIDEYGNTLEKTYPKRAKGLVKSGRARYVDEKTILLVTALPKNNNLEEKLMNNLINEQENILEENVVTENNEEIEQEELETQTVEVLDIVEVTEKKEKVKKEKSGTIIFGVLTVISAISGYFLLIGLILGIIGIVNGKKCVDKSKTPLALSIIGTSLCAVKIISSVISTIVLSCILSVYIFLIVVAMTSGA